MVGDSVAESSGARSCPASGWSSSARRCASTTGGTSPSTVSRNARTSGIRDWGSCRRPSASSTGAALSSALSAAWGSDAWPLRPRSLSRKGAVASPRRREVVHALAEHTALPSALVQPEVGAHVGLAREPRRSESVADLLVRRQSQQVARGRAPSRASDANATVAAATPFHVERATPPDLAVDHVARPRIARPVRRVGEHGVRVRQEQKRRPVAAREPRDDVRAIRRPSEHGAGHAVPREVAVQAFGSAGLVPWGIDGVEPEQVLEETDDLLAERHEGVLSAFDRAVSSFRTSQSSGKNTVCTSRPSTSTGVPCVPTTASPITRATTR